MKAPEGLVLSTAALRDRVMVAVLEMEQKADVDRSAGRVVQAERWDVLRKAVEEYIKLLENSVRAARQTIKALESNSTRTRAEKATDGDERVLGL